MFNRPGWVNNQCRVSEAHLSTNWTRIGRSVEHHPCGCGGGEWGEVGQCLTWSTSGGELARSRGGGSAPVLDAAWEAGGGRQRRRAGDRATQNRGEAAGLRELFAYESRSTVAGENTRQAAQLCSTRLVLTFFHEL